MTEGRRDSVSGSPKRPPVDPPVDGFWHPSPTVAECQVVPDCERGTGLNAPLMFDGWLPSIGSSVSTVDEDHTPRCVRGTLILPAVILS